MTTKKITIGAIALVASTLVLVLSAGVIRFNFTNGGDSLSEKVSSTDVKNISLTVSGEEVHLLNGKFERESAPGSASKNVYALFGEPVYGDIDGDGDQDALSYLTENSGGSGTFFSVVAAINTDGAYRGTNAVFLGDRIAPQNINFIDGRFAANFAVRKDGEPFTAQPSVGKSVWIHYDKTTGEIGEWVKDFPGETDAGRMTLTMKSWEWMSTIDNKKVTITPKIAKKFLLTLKSDGTFSASTDCNGVGGEYRADKTTIKFDKMMSTLMFCEGSQESLFAGLLSGATSYNFTGKGELVLTGSDASVSTFK